MMKVQTCLDQNEPSKNENHEETSLETGLALDAVKKESVALSELQIILSRIEYCKNDDCRKHKMNEELYDISIPNRYMFSVGPAQTFSIERTQTVLGIE